MSNQTEEPKVCDADSVWLWRDQHHYLQVETSKPPRHIASVEYFRPLDKRTLFKRAGLEEGMDAMRYCNNLLRIIENQTSEINRLRELRDRDMESAVLRHTLDCDLVRHPNSTRCTCQ